MIKAIVFSALLALVPTSVSFADILEVSWAHPTQRVDGTTLPLSEIAGYRLSWSVKGVEQPVRTIPVVTTYSLDTGALSGKTCVYMVTVDTTGLTSAPSETVCRNAKPNPPSNMDIK